MLVFALERGRVVLDEPVLLEWVQEELGVERNVREIVGVLDGTYEILSVAAEPAGAAATAAWLPAPLSIASNGGRHPTGHTQLDH